MKMTAKKISVITLLLLTFFTVYALWADKALTGREFQIKDEKIPESFNGFRIVQVSDLHNTSFGEGNTKLLKAIEDAHPDIIAVTGDVVDSRRTNTDIATDFFEKALTIAPVYYITGNHESRIGNCEDFLDEVTRLGVRILENERITLVKESDEITLCGIEDPAFSADYLFDNEAAVAERSIMSLGNTETFDILLSHRPEYFDIYAEYGFDLVLSGHAHGGQFRLPFIGGIIAPGQGFFPEYDSGLYEKADASMIVSRGLGNSIIPLRLFNRPEIITVVLNSD